MSFREIIPYPQRILRQRAKEVEKITPEIRELIPQMIETMERNQGVGLAAPQIGISQRIIVVKDRDGVHAFLNPQILRKSKEQEIEEEGCLSLPGIFLKLKRATKVEVLCETLNGNTVRIQAEGLGARIFQHEIDHLNGKLIIDHLSMWARFKLRKKLKEMKDGTHEIPH